MLDRACFPSVIPALRNCVRCFSPHRKLIRCGVHKSFSLQTTGDFGRSESFNAKFKDTSYGLCRRLIHNPLLRIVLGFLVTERNGRSYALSFVCLGLPHSTDLLACLRGIPLVEDVVERHHFRAGVFQSINVFLNSYEADTECRVFDLQVFANVEVVAPEAAEVFDDDHTDLSVLDHPLHSLKVRTIKGRTRYTVVYEEHCVVESV